MDFATMPQPPVDMVMPYTPQMIFGFGNVVPIAIALWFCFRYLKSHGSAFGFLFLLAGAVTTLNEPVVDILGLCWFPRHGTFPLFEAWGVKIPWWMLPVYTWYVGGQAFYSYRRFEDGITTRGLFRLYLIFAVANALLETPGLWLGVYTYYGNQPFQFLKFPYWWAIVNPLMPMTMAALVFRFRPLLTGARQLLVVPMGLMAAAMTNGAVAAPVWISLNSGAGLVVTHLAAVVSLGFGLLFAYGMSQLVATDAALPQAARVRVSAPGSVHAATR